ncbi:hypothetical protein [Azospirillum sp. sgz302134]
MATLNGLVRRGWVVKRPNGLHYATADGVAAFDGLSLPAAPPSQCEHRTATGILSARRCTRPATKDGYCTRHHPSYVSPTTARYLAEHDAQAERE